jgi:hypothetical protein
MTGRSFDFDLGRIGLRLAHGSHARQQSRGEGAGRS